MRIWGSVVSLEPKIASVAQNSAQCRLFSASLAIKKKKKEKGSWMSVEIYFSVSWLPYCCFVREVRITFNM